MVITSAGIGSGLDLESIIEAYVTAEAVPNEVRLQKKEQRLNAELSGVGQFKSALSTFSNTLKTLSSTSDFNKQSITSSSTDISVTTNGSASNGVFSIEVKELALATRSESTLFTAPTDTVGSGILTFTAGANNFNVTIDAGDSLSAIRDKINAESTNFGVTANVLTTDAGTFLSYTSTVTGLANELAVTTSDSSLDAISTNSIIKQNAIDAKIEVNGNLVTKPTNVFKDVIEDVTITANKKNVGGITTLTIAQDVTNGKTLVQNFVSAYNTLRSTMDALGDAKTGALAFDPNIRQMKAQLNNIVTDAVSGLSGSYQSLADMGVTIDKYGKLEINPIPIGTQLSGVEKLDKALVSNTEDIGKIFASTDGVATQLNTLIDTYNGSSGSLTKRNSALSLEVSGIKDEYTALETRLRDYENGLRKRFGFLDQTVSQFNATSSWLTSTLASLSGNNSKNK